MKKFPSRKKLILYTGESPASAVEKLANEIKKDKRQFFMLLLAQDLGAFVPINSVYTLGLNTKNALEAAGEIVAQFSDKEIEYFLGDTDGTA